MNDNYTIPAFAEPITELPDTPSLTAAELKRRFQAPADEVRLAHNALAKCVEGITSATYPDTVTEDMLTDALAEKINGKADQSDLDAEVEAREAGDAALDDRITTVETSLPQKSEVYCGTFTGNGEASQFIELGFTPKAVLVLPVSAYFTGPYEIYSAMALQNTPSVYNGNTALQIEQNGFRAYYHSGSPSTSIYLNYSGASFYLAFR